jgi:hypothetical protein
VQSCGGGGGELDGQDAGVLAGFVRVKEFAAEDCEGFEWLVEGGGGVVDLDEEFGGDGL